MIKKIAYASTKYLTYGLKFFQLLIIAKYLGPAGLAVFGFAQLVSLYVSFLHFGIPLSIHAMLSVSKNEESLKAQSYISDGFTFLILSSVFFCVMGVCVILIAPSLFEKFEFHKYGTLSIIMGANLIIVQFFSNIYQVYAQYVRVALIELISVILPFIVVLLYKNNADDLLQYILWVSALNIIFNLFFFLYKAPFKISFSLRRDPLNLLIKMGVPMLLSNVAFYLITISIRSISSYYYDLQQIGHFTFGLNISNSVMLGLNAISWTFYSTILSNTCDDVNDAHAYIQKVNRIYNFILIITVFVGILCLPALFYFLPAYKVFYSGIGILLISQIFMSVSMGYNSLLVAQKKQNYLVVISFITLSFAIIASVCVCVFDMPMIFQPGVILIAMFLYSSLIFYLAAKICKKKFMNIFFEVLSWKVFISIFLLLFIIFSDAGIFLNFACVLIYFLLCYKDIQFLLKSWNEIRKA